MLLPQGKSQYCCIDFELAVAAADAGTWPHHAVPIAIHNCQPCSTATGKLLDIHKLNLRLSRPSPCAQPSILRPPSRSPCCFHYQSIFLATACIHLPAFRDGNRLRPTASGDIPRATRRARALQEPEFYVAHKGTRTKAIASTAFSHLWNAASLKYGDTRRHAPRGLPQHRTWCSART